MSCAANAVGAARARAEALGERLIAGQLRERALAQQIGARVSDVREEQHVVGDVGGSERRAHARQLWILPGGLGHTIVDPAIEAQPSLDHLVGSPRVDPDVPFREMERKMRERGNGQATRRFPDPDAAHAVGHDHAVGRFVEAGGHFALGKTGRDRLLMATHPDDQIVILVGGPGARAGARGEFHPDGRRQRSKLLVRPSGGQHQWSLVATVPHFVHTNTSTPDVWAASDVPSPAVPPRAPVVPFRELYSQSLAAAQAIEPRLDEAAPESGCSLGQLVERKDDEPDRGRRRQAETGSRPGRPGAERGRGHRRRPLWWGSAGQRSVGFFNPFSKTARAAG